MSFGKYLLAIVLSVSAVVVLTAAQPAKSGDPLPCWNDGASKSAIISFVTKVTKEKSPDYVNPEERIAVFDNDGTLWSE
jgi:hypothetical protein